MEKMEIFYKATQVDGFDFYSGTVDYAGHLNSGEWLPVKDAKTPQCCTGDVYHASTSKADTLIGATWPCRLFEVEGLPVAEEKNKRGFSTLRVVRELPAWEALGPNGQDVVSHLESVKEVIAGNAVSNAARDAARDAAGQHARDAARDAAWHAAWHAARHAAWHAAWHTARQYARYAVWYAAGDAAGDAAQALVVRDLISAEYFEILTSSWIGFGGSVATGL